MAISLSYNKIAYSLPEGISLESPIGKWLSHQNLSQIDRGDEMSKDRSSDQASDRKLGKMELFQAVMEEYQATYQEAVKIAVQSKNSQFKNWEEKAKHLNELAGMIQELGYEPAFHANYLQEKFRDYHFRMVKLIQEVPETERNSQNFFLKVANLASPSCSSGGLGLSYLSRPSSTSGFGLEQMILACWESDRSHWGVCTGTALKSALLSLGALAVYSGPKTELKWVEITNTPSIMISSSMGNSISVESVSHAFVFLNFPTLRNSAAIDPSRIEFKYYKTYPQSYLIYSEIWRTFLSTYYNAKCNNFLSAGKIDEAEITCKKGFELQPNSIESINAMGIMFLDGKPDLSRSKFFFLEGLKKEPENLLLNMNLGIVLLREDNFPEAERIFASLVERGVRDGKIFEGYGGALAVQEKYAEAIQKFEQAVQLNPRNNRIHCKLGEILPIQKEYARAEQSLKICLTAYPDAPHYLIRLANILFSQNKLDEAASIYKKVLTLSSAAEEKTKATDQLKEIEIARRPWWKKILSLNGFFF